MRLDLVIVGAAILFLGYAYLNDAAAVELLWNKFLEWLGNVRLFN
jgi:hypothetical protein